MAWVNPIRHRPWLRCVLSFTLVLVLLLPTLTATSSQEARVPVVVSFYPLQEVVQRVGGERVEVTNLVPAGAEPHDFEFTPRDLERLRAARLLVYLGAGFQPSLEKALETLRVPNLLTIDVTQGMSLIESTEQEAGPRRPGEPAPRDPHVWLDLALMKDIVGKVRVALARVDPDGREVYEANDREYLGQLDALDGEFNAGLESCRKREVVTSHAAFGYLVRRYRLQQVPIAGLSPEVEPSPRRLQEVIRFARQRDVRTIYFETLVDPRVAETIAREVGARTLVLNPIEGLTAAEQAEGKGYVDLMRQNLANLREGLECT